MTSSRNWGRGSDPGPGSLRRCSAAACRPGRRDGGKVDPPAAPPAKSGARDPSRPAGLTSLRNRKNRLENLWSCVAVEDWDQGGRAAAAGSPPGTAFNGEAGSATGIPAPTRVKAYAGASHLNRKEGALDANLFMPHFGRFETQSARPGPRDAEPQAQPEALRALRVALPGLPGDPVPDTGGFGRNDQGAWH